MYAVLTGDLVQHQKYEDYEALAKRLAQVLRHITQLSTTPLEKPFSIYRGDSFQLLVPASRAVSSAYTIRLALLAASQKEVDARIGIGIGPENNWGAKLATSRGQSFTYAAEALDWLESKGKNRRIELRGGPDTLLQYDIGHINPILSLLDALSMQWTIAGIESIRISRNNPRLTQAELAAALGISQPSFTKRLHNANWPVMNDAIQHINKTLKRHTPPTPDHVQ